MALALVSGALILSVLLLLEKHLPGSRKSDEEPGGEEKKGEG